MKRFSIKSLKDGPFEVLNLIRFENSRGEKLETEENMHLCRCGGSDNKPFCDGTHRKNGFKSDKLRGRQPDKVDNYRGSKITIHDNRGVCSHAGHCTDNAPKVFRMKKELWIEPNGEPPSKTAKVIKMCPSGALSFSCKGKLYKDHKRQEKIGMYRNGPYKVQGGPDFEADNGSKPESKEHFALCRCGGSKNKPFCDGTHWHIKFRDRKN